MSKAPIKKDADPKKLDPKNVKTEEVRMLLTLESIDRDLEALEERRSEKLAEFNEDKKKLEKLRDGVLADLEDHRLGVQRLIPEDTPNVTVEKGGGSEPNAKK